MSWSTGKLGTRSSRLVRRRWLVQAGFLAVWLIPLRLFNVCGAVFHCYACPLALFACPIGVTAQFSALHVFPFMAVGTLLVVGGMVGAFVCGWACPFGFMQDLAAKARTCRYELPAWAGHFRYVVLVGAVLAIPFLWGEGHALFICRVCPAGALEGAIPAKVEQALANQPINEINNIKIWVTVFVVAGMFVKFRPWCTLLCPLGAIFGLFNRWSALYLRFIPERCTSCKLCHTQCRVGLEPDRRANDPRCIRCLECTHCGALTVGSPLARPKDATPEETGDESSGPTQTV